MPEMDACKYVLRTHLMDRLGAQEEIHNRVSGRWFIIQRPVTKQPPELVVMDLRISRSISSSLSEYHGRVINFFRRLFGQ